MPARVWRWSVLAGQMDHVVGEIQCDFIQREIGVLDLLGEHDVAVAIVAGERSGSVGTHGELPDLKFLGGNSLVVGLNDRDFVEKPIRPTVLASKPPNRLLPHLRGLRAARNTAGRRLDQDFVR